MRKSQELRPFLSAVSVIYVSLLESKSEKAEGRGDGTATRAPRPAPSTLLLRERDEIARKAAHSAQNWIAEPSEA